MGSVSALWHRPLVALRTGATDMCRYDINNGDVLRLYLRLMKYFLLEKEGGRVNVLFCRWQSS